MTSTNTGALNTYRVTYERAGNMGDHDSTTAQGVYIDSDDGNVRIVGRNDDGTHRTVFWAPREHIRSIKLIADPVAAESN